MRLIGLARRLTTTTQNLLSSQSLAHQTSHSPSPLLRNTHHLSQSLTLTHNQTHSNSKTVPINHTNVEQVLQLLRSAHSRFASKTEAIAYLDESGIRLTEDLVGSAIRAAGDEWELAYLGFKWGERSGCSSVRIWELMVSVLGEHKKFGTAWRVVRDMVRSSMDVRGAVVLMIESYAAANDPQKAIRAFEVMEKFRLSQDSEAYHTLLDALCRNGNIEEAEEFMLLNKKAFPLSTQGFNIILHGWCNDSLDMVEAKRVWREMSSYCITPDATTYTNMISCFSKSGNLFDSLRLYDEMKKRGWTPGRGVYNSLIYVLTRENCWKEALNLVDKIKLAGLKPDSTTYNSMILPLCEAKKLKDAREVLDDMIRDGVDPTRDTYHAFLEEVDNVEGALELLKQMSEAGFDPNGHTFRLILDKFLELKQPENSLRMWEEMAKYKIEPNSSHYIMLISGMVSCGWVEKGREFYEEMRLKGFLGDPKLEKLFAVSSDHDKDKDCHQKKVKVRKKIRILIRKKHKFSRRIPLDTKM
ncbi:hypothetical protein Sjap_019016 [Stephania japonica]|uniref:Pentatricopeptide repeat-containing protein n=1 Tax=Stephania japonica TaxID=461633 RepID=A0AAP0F3G7_9MAGN